MHPDNPISSYSPMDLANSLCTLIRVTTEDFNKLTEQEWTDKPLPHKWSKKEILGHLIDSAVNNLRRFNEVQFLSDNPYVIQKYQQEALVRSNKYQELPVSHLISLWSAVNAQIMHVLRAYTPDELHRAVLTPEGDHQTVGWLADDYVVHLRHHLAQIFGKR